MTDASQDSYRLIDHVRDLKRKKYPRIIKALKKADVLILQGMGSGSSPKIASQITAYCPESTRIYYYETEFEQARGPARLVGMKKKLGADIILAEEMLHSLYDLGYTYESFHQGNDYHGNMVNSYLAALQTSAMLYEQDCAQIPAEQYDMWYLDRLKLEEDESDASVQARFAQICQKIDQVNVEYQEKSIRDILTTRTFSIE